MSESDKRLILEIYKEQNSGARRLEIVIEHKYGKHIPHNAIHEVLLENGLAEENSKKKKRRKPYIRYEREHSMSLVHLDWHTSKINGKEVCVVLDDSSRFILAGGEFAVATAEISIGLVRKVLEDYGKVRKIREVLTIMVRNSSPTSWIKMVNLKVHSVLSWPKMESLISWQG